jgi:sugar phosphate isomerase/epimerase
VEASELTICTATLFVEPFTATDAQVADVAEAAVAAGYRSVSAWQHHLPALAAAGFSVAVIEAAVSWANGDPGTAAAEAEQLAEAVARHGADLLLAVCLEPELADPGTARANLAALAARVTDAGGAVCVEFLPWSGIPDLATAWSLVEPLGPSAGLLLDTWHWVRQPGGPDLDLLARIPGDRVLCLQVCDAAPTAGPDPMAEAMGGRLLPGAGVVDFASLRRVLGEIGADPVVATEVFNPPLVAELGPAAAAAAMFAASQRALGAN